MFCIMYIVGFWDCQWFTILYLADFTQLYPHVYNTTSLGRKKWFFSSVLHCCTGASRLATIVIGKHSEPLQSDSAYTTKKPHIVTRMCTVSIQQCATHVIHHFWAVPCYFVERTCMYTNLFLGIVTS